ncbi:SIN3-HDAC complex-associated factor [Thrips palmi]|uniref:SIN3-HDAC complex-associated factor n=1 Tax=Thrips palmi TaxID=161013 RepID=A0A6P8YG17_THRPL|nr:SIN3-HDAC complex-associated factor [Thrips palmi]XP_034232881.1 SIN3-HDAC complex-associated factor [Thrips palmi]XP_034232882.1 SIN3-HDAC complex-associated factor [Thrips palmi]
MFSFHKPKVYRSSAGCCICKAKSSSSRFTDSKKYEEDFMECFRLPERRSGEICNACVLLVKRWKKLPPDSERNWRHVVDARAGPGTKSLTKFKAKNKKKKLKAEGSKKLESVKKKHVYVKSADRDRSPATFSDGEEMEENGFSGPPSLAPSPTPSEDGDVAIPTVKKRRNRSRSPQHKSSLKHRSSPQISGFLDMKIWKRIKICCGIIFQGPNGEIVKDPRFYKPCAATARVKEEPQLITEEVVQEEIPMDIVEHKPVIEQPAQQVDLQLPPPLPVSVLAAASPEGSPQQSPHRSPIPLLPAPQPLPLASVKVVVANAVASMPGKSFSDSSSDSGYDESSNQGPQENGAATPTHDTAGDFPKRCHLQPVDGKVD